MLIHVSIYITNNLQSIFLVFKLYDIYPPLYLWAVTYLSPDGPDSSGCHKHRRHIVLLQDPEVDPRVRCPHRFTLNKQGVLHFIFFQISQICFLKILQILDRLYPFSCLVRGRKHFTNRQLS